MNARVPMVGVDGCPAGWVAVCDGTALVFDGEADGLRALLAHYGDAAVVAVDMPIGLLDDFVPGGRDADRAARRVLGFPRSSSVFSAPPRRARGVRTLPEAQALGVRIALQTLNILDKVFAVDDVMTPAVQRHVFEAHPELAFTALNGGQPMRLSKRRSAGRRERRAVLDAAGIAVPETPRGAKEDDVLDATALTWVARRIARGEAVCLPDPPPLDSRGLHMGIWT